MIIYDKVRRSQTMRYWWVNQNQTLRHELAGGYLSSPKRNTNGARNPFYEFIREVSPSQAPKTSVDAETLRVASPRYASGAYPSRCAESPRRGRENPSGDVEATCPPAG